MNDHICQQIENSAHYRELVDKRQRFAFILSIIMLVIYVGFILLIAFAPHWLGTPLHAGTSANGEFDRLNKAVLQEVKAS